MAVGTARSTRATSQMKALKIVPAFFLQTALVLGTIKSIGVFLPELESKLGITSTDLGLSLGLFQGFTFGISPIPTYIYCNASNTYRRLLLISGAVLASVGLISGSTIANNAQLAFYLSVSGIGTNILSTVLVITFHSQAGDHFKLLYGVGKSGYSLGMALVPLLAHYLATVYGWRGSLMIVGSIMAHLIPLSLLVDTTAESDESFVDEGISEDSPEGSPECRLDESPERRKSEECRDSSIQEDSPEKCPERSKLHRNIITTPRHHKQSVSENLSIFGKVSKDITESIFNRDRWLTFLVITTGLYGIIGGGWHAFLIPRAVSRGMPTSRALTLAYSSGGGCFIGRFFSGAVLNTKLFSGHDWFNILTVINCISLLVDILLADFGVVIVTSFVSALCIAARNILLVMIYKERSPNTDFPKLYAVSEIIFGTAQFIGAFVSGFLADVFHNFNASFIFLLAVEACILFMMVILKLTKSTPE